MSGGAVVAWLCSNEFPRCTVATESEQAMEAYRMLGRRIEPLVLATDYAALQADLAAAIARAEAAEARGVMLTMGLRAAVTALAHASESDAIYTRTYEHASHALRDYAIDRAAIAAQQAEGRE